MFFFSCIYYLNKSPDPENNKKCLFKIILGIYQISIDNSYNKNKIKYQFSEHGNESLLY